MQKKIIYMAFFFILLTSCEDYYNPTLKGVSEMLVVESHITNDPNQNFVKLTKTLGFNSTNLPEKVTGAKVEMVDAGGLETKANETSPGYFIFPETPVPGRKYTLRITYQRDIYLSDQVIMPPIPVIDSLYTNHKVDKTFRTDVYGGPTQIETPGREICIDAPITSKLEYYRFNTRSIIQWLYPTLPPPIPPPTLFGWISYYDRGIFNITGPKEFSVSDQVKNHPLLFLGYDNRAYLDSSAQIFCGWILIIDQYGIPKESYDFHEKLNKQFLAEGSLFDPILTQVYGNIHCTTHPNQIVAGFFDMNSYRQYRYFLYFTNQNSRIVQRRINRYPEITVSDYLVGTQPGFWENIYGN